MSKKTILFRTALLVTLVISLLSANVSVNAAPKLFTSSDEPTRLVELYTSEGCSSCPSAERWISKFTDNKDLWRTIIPINFHVDYWDYLGWKDPFSFSEFSQRQRTYKRQGNTKNVATPGFVISGEGWNGWFRGRDLPGAFINPKNELQAVLDEQKIEVKYATSQKKRLDVHVAILGFGITTEVKSGENRGKNLAHDFVVIGYEKSRLKRDDQLQTAIMDLPDVVEAVTTGRSLVVWVSEQGNPEPIQVLGGWL
ncbi:MAG: hypothetical protein ACJAVI_002251 [Candidatus Azotimanducaceae bacterium]|jgi:hypothetical protein